MHEAIVLETIQTGTVKIFSSMLSKELTCEAPHEEDSDRATDGVIAQISLVGACAMTSLVVCSAELACSIASALLMEECNHVNADVLDAMAEIANMIIGNAKTELEMHLGGVHLSIPTVTYGRNVVVHNSKRWVVVPFLMDGQQLLVKVCFEPVRKDRRTVESRN